jgi:gas vesicle protein
MKRVLNFLLGAIIGGAIGGTLAILLAPSSGDQTRTGIKKWSDDFVAEIKLAGEQKRSELEFELEQLRHPIQIQ